MESDQCILVDEADSSLGSATKRHCHTVREGTQPPPLHRAFSVFLFDPATGQLLLQRRAASKRTFPGLWSNTCCSHPLQGETIRQAMRRKLQDELGIPQAMIEEEEFVFWGKMHYHALSANPVWAEHESCLSDALIPDNSPYRDVVDHLYALIKEAVPIRPNPQEVDAVQWMGPTELNAAVRAAPEQYSPWFKAILRDWLLSPQDWWQRLLTRRAGVVPIPEIIRYPRALQ